MRNSADWNGEMQGAKKHRLGEYLDLSGDRVRGEGWGLCGRTEVLQRWSSEERDSGWVEWILAPPAVGGARWNSVTERALGLALFWGRVCQVYIFMHESQ